MDKPIFFNTSMVMAIMEGKKTTTRRIIKSKYENADIDWFKNKYGKRLVHIQNDVPPPTKNPNGTTSHKLIAMEEIKKPYQIGDTLYVRETWQELNGGYIYKAGYSDNDNIKWKPSIHMPKKATRLFLRVKDIKAEKLHEMDKADFIKEGLEERNCFNNFCKLWDSTIKKEDIDKFGWFANPFVWVIDFEVLNRNI